MADRLLARSVGNPVGSDGWTPTAVPRCSWRPRADHGPGLRDKLSEQGIEVIGDEDDGRQILIAAERLRPDSVVLDLNDGDAHRSAGAIRRASPASKVVLWARDETVMEVLDPDRADTAGWR